MQAQTDSFRDRLYQILSALAVALAVLACRPFVEAGFDDDWGYAYITRNLARTGHFSYGGFTVATLLFQAYWGSLLVRLFGFSFQLLRFSTLPFAMGCAIICYRLARMAGLLRVSSLFASLVFGTSPLFVPLAASFMTDVYGCFFVLLSIYFGTCAAGTSLSTRKRILWLVASTAAGYVGGLDRQTGYIAPACVLLWTIWRWRRNRLMLLAAICLLAVLNGGAFLAIWWQWQQPLSDGAVKNQIVSWRNMAIFPAQFILTLTVLILPAVVRIGTGGLAVPARLYAISSLGVVGGFAAYWRVSHNILFPWMVDIISPVGILLDGLEMRGSRPVVLHRGFRMALTVAVLIVLVRVAALLLSAHESRNRGKIPGELPVVLQIFSIFAIVYTGTLFFQSSLLTFDRYLLPLIPLALIAVLLWTQKLSGVSPTAVNWCLMTIFALFGVAISHDYYAALQARLTAFQRVEALGVAAKHICGGLELDGWTQAETAGRLYRPDPVSAPSKRDGPVSGYWFLTYAPDIDPLYFLSWSEEPGLKSASIPAVSFGAWLPPFRREVKIFVPEARK
jgi:hypothetical protein